MPLRAARASELAHRLVGVASRLLARRTLPIPSATAVFVGSGLVRPRQAGVRVLQPLGRICAPRVGTAHGKPEPLRLRRQPARVLPVRGPPVPQNPRNTIKYWLGTDDRFELRAEICFIELRWR